MQNCLAPGAKKSPPFCDTLLGVGPLFQITVYKELRLYISRFKETGVFPKLTKGTSLWNFVPNSEFLWTSKCDKEAKVGGHLLIVLDNDCGRRGSVPPTTETLTDNCHFTC